MKKRTAEDSPTTIDERSTAQSQRSRQHEAEDRRLKFMFQSPRSRRGQRGSRRRLAFFHRHDFNRISLVMRAQDQMLARHFDVLHSAVAVFVDRVHVELALA